MGTTTINGYTYLKWLIPLLVTIAIAANGLTITWFGTRFEEHSSRPHVGAISKDEYKYIRKDLKDVKTKVDKLSTQLTRLETLMSTWNRVAGRGGK